MSLPESWALVALSIVAHIAIVHYAPIEITKPIRVELDLEALDTTCGDDPFRSRSREPRVFHLSRRIRPVPAALRRGYDLSLWAAPWVVLGAAIDLAADARNIVLACSVLLASLLWNDVVRQAPVATTLMPLFLLPAWLLGPGIGALATSLWLATLVLLAWTPWQVHKPFRVPPGYRIVSHRIV